MALSIARGLALLTAGALAISACTGATPGSTASPGATPTVATTATPEPATPEPTTVVTPEPTDEPTATAGPTATAEPTLAPTPTEAAVTYPVDVTDAANVTFTFDAPQEALGCLWTGCMETLAELGVVPLGAPGTAETHDSVRWFPHGPPAHAIGDHLNPEEWAAAGVELLVNSLPHGDHLTPLEDAAPIFFLHFYPHEGSLAGVEAWKENTRLLGQLTGQAAAAEESIARYDAFVAALAERAPADAAEREIIYMFHSDDGTYSTMPFEIPFCDAIATNGFGRCANPEGWDAFAVSAEAFLEADPEWIAYGIFDPTITWEDRDDPAWRRLTAVKEGRVYDADAGYYCCGVRSLEHALQDYAFNVWGEASGVPDPGPIDDFEPRTSPLLTGG